MKFIIFLISIYHIYKIFFKYLNMILSTSRLNKILKTFKVSRNVAPYDKSIEKQEMQNAKNFISNYHIYGTPFNGFNKTKIIYFNKTKTNKSKISSLDKQSNNSKYSYKNKKAINLQNYTNMEDIERAQSLTNLRKTQKLYQQQKLIQKAKSTSNIFRHNYINNNLYNPYLPLQSVNTIYLNKQSLYMPNIYNFSRNNRSMDLNPLNSYSQKNKMIKSLNDIPSNPEDVVIKNLPANFSQVINPVSSNIIESNNMPTNLNGENIPIPENKNENLASKVEEINTDVIPNKEIEQNNQEIGQNNQEIEEPKEPKEQEEQKENVEKIEEPAPAQKGKYQITAFNGPIKLPEGYSTDDIDEFNAIQNINDDLSNWTLRIDKPNYKIYSKPFKTQDQGNDSRMFYLDATIDCPASEVNRQLNSFDLRKEWEDSLKKKGKLIKEEDLGNGIKIIDYYGFIKMPIIFSDRDMVVRKKIWENYNGEKDCCLNELHSIESSEYPAKDDPVRATLENKSKYVKPLGPNQTKFYYVNKFDLKVSVSASMMEGKGADSTEKWFKDFLKQLKK